MTKSLSIITTLYSSESYIAEFYSRTVKAAETIASDFEIVLVNDGSKDNSADKVREICEQDSRVVLVDLSRNFGHHEAILAGLSYAKGELVWLIDSDLEESPEWLLTFYKEMEKSADVDVVYGVQRQRKGRFFERITGKIQYDLLDALLPFAYPRDAVTARLMTYDYVRALLSFPESSAPIFGLMTMAGFNQKKLLVEKLSTSPSTYTVASKLKMFARTVASFSSWPLFAVFYLGLACLFAGVVGILLAVLNLIFFTPFPGWTSIIASIWTMGGLILMSVGIVGIYLQKIYIQTKHRPKYIVKSVFTTSLSTDSYA